MSIRTTQCTVLHHLLLSSERKCLICFHTDNVHVVFSASDAAGGIVKRNVYDIVYFRKVEILR